jgi:hypothetical protein
MEVSHVYDDEGSLLCNLFLPSSRHLSSLAMGASYYLIDI